jgi:uncharacterized HAD superfamily protein
MKAILVFIDGTICDTRHRNHLLGSEDFFLSENVLQDIPTNGSVEFLNELAEMYALIYIGARPGYLKDVTAQWLHAAGFPQGDIYLGDSQDKRMEIVSSLKDRYHFAAGIGDRWDDNELHLELGCQSFILREYTPDWNTVRKYLSGSSFSHQILLTF